MCLGRARSKFLFSGQIVVPIIIIKIIKININIWLETRENSSLPKVWMGQAVLRVVDSEHELFYLH